MENSTEANTHHSDGGLTHSVQNSLNLSLQQDISIIHGVILHINKDRGRQQEMYLDSNKFEKVFERLNRFLRNVLK